uniref:Uncharacterized protein n=1 Tax=Heterorhabditis bacteriophora TaxID=37862 RepID=A0A1I7XH22_HETBA
MLSRYAAYLNGIPTLLPLGCFLYTFIFASIQFK